MIQWIYKTYGHDKAALCSTVTRYRAKGAIRDVGKAIGLPEDLIKTLSFGIWSWSETVGERQVRELGLNPDDRRLTLTLERDAFRRNRKGDSFFCANQIHHSGR